jgi:hypothetical protein
MNQNDHVGKKNKTRLIGFRVNEDTFSEIENRAILAGKTPNDWCRDELLARLGDGVTLTANEELIHSEVFRFGNVLAQFLYLLANNQLTPETSQQLLTTVNLDGKKLAKRYFSGLAKKAQKEGA